MLKFLIIKCWKIDHPHACDNFKEKIAFLRKQLKWTLAGLSVMTCLFAQDSSKASPTPMLLWFPGCRQCCAHKLLSGHSGGWGAGSWFLALKKL